MIIKLNDNDVKKLHIDCPTYFTSAQLITNNTTNINNNNNNQQIQQHIFQQNQIHNFENQIFREFFK